MNGFEFYKYNSNGNDFIIIDDRNNFFDIKKEIIQKICLRQFFVGADGLILLKNSNSSDFRMQIFNSDGNEAAMCGNGILCISKFIKDFVSNKRSFIIETQAGCYKIVIDDFISFFSKIPKIIKLNQKIDLGCFKANLTIVDSGVMHSVIFTDDIDKLDIYNLGKQIRYFKDLIPTNVDFCQILNDSTIKVRVYEKGVENETFCCSTGALAIAKAFYELNQKINKLTLQFKGGIIKISVLDNLFELSGNPIFNFKAFTNFFD